MYVVDELYEPPILSSRFELVSAGFPPIPTSGVEDVDDEAAQARRHLDEEREERVCASGVRDVVAVGQRVGRADSLAQLGGRRRVRKGDRSAAGECLARDEARETGEDSPRHDVGNPASLVQALSLNKIAAPADTAPP